MIDFYQDGWRIDYRNDIILKHIHNGINNLTEKFNTFISNSNRGNALQELINTFDLLHFLGMLCL